MLSYCLKCRKKTESKNPRARKTKKENQCFYQNMEFVIAKDRYLSSNKKLAGY